MTTSVTIETTQQQVVIERDGQRVEVAVQRAAQVEVVVAREVAQGPRGPAGPAGGTTITRTAGEALGGHRVVAANSAGGVIHVSPSDALADAVTGVTTGAAASGQPATIQVAGEMTEPSWSWSPGPVWLGAAGILTQVLPTSGAIVRVGTALGPTSIIIQPRLLARL